MKLTVAVTSVAAPVIFGLNLIPFQFMVSMQLCIFVSTFCKLGIDRTRFKTIKNHGFPVYLTIFNILCTNTIWLVYYPAEIVNICYLSIPTCISLISCAFPVLISRRDSLSIYFIDIPIFTILLMIGSFWSELGMIWIANFYALALVWLLIKKKLFTQHIPFQNILSGMKINAIINSTSGYFWGSALLHILNLNHSSHDAYLLRIGERLAMIPSVFGIVIYRHKIQALVLEKKINQAIRGFYKSEVYIAICGICPLVVFSFYVENFNSTFGVLFLPLMIGLMPPVNFIGDQLGVGKLQARLSVMFMITTIIGIYSEIITFISAVSFYVIWQILERTVILKKILQSNK